MYRKDETTKLWREHHLWTEEDLARNNWYQWIHFHWAQHGFSNYKKVRRNLYIFVCPNGTIQIFFSFHLLSILFITGQENQNNNKKNKSLSQCVYINQISSTLTNIQLYDITNYKWIDTLKNFGKFLRFRMVVWHAVRKSKV